MVVPHGKHTAEDVRVVLLERLVADDRRRVVFVEILRVEVVVVVTRCRHNVSQAIGNADELVALLLHLHRVRIAVVPDVHDDVLRLHRRRAVGVCQRTPEHSLLAVALHEANVVVRVGTELFHHLLLCVRILVRADVYARTAEHGVLTADVFLPQRVHERVSLRIGEVEVVHAVVLTAYFGLVLRERQRVGRGVELGNNLHAVLLRQLLKVDELALRVRTVLCRQSGICVALQAERSLRLVPVTAEVLAETVVVEVYLQRVHLVVRHDLRQVAEIAHGDELASAVNHETAQAILRNVRRRTFGQFRAVALFEHLEECARTPEKSANGRSR